MPNRLWRINNALVRYAIASAAAFVVDLGTLLALTKILHMQPV